MTLPRGSRGKETEKKPCYPDCDDPFCERVHPVEPDNMKKLVEEIGELLSQSVAALVAPATDEEYSLVKRELARRFITRTLQAVADGKVKWPGEEGRRSILAFGPVATWAGIMANRGATDLIAFRREKPDAKA